MTPWTVAHQAPLSMGLSRQEYWSGLSCPPPGNLPNPGTETVSLSSLALVGEFFTTSTTWEALGSRIGTENITSFQRTRKECRTSQVVLEVKNPPANARDIRDKSSVPGWGRSSGGGHDNPLQYSHLENPLDRRAWQATVHRVQRVGHD